VEIWSRYSGTWSMAKKYLGNVLEKA